MLLELDFFSLENKEEKNNKNLGNSEKV